MQLSFEGTNLIMNILLFVIVLLIFAMIIALLVFCRRYVNKSNSESAKKYLSKLEGMMMYNSVLRAILEIYFSTCITTMYALTQD